MTCLPPPVKNLGLVAGSGVFRPSVGSVRYGIDSEAVMIVMNPESQRNSLFHVGWLWNEGVGCQKVVFVSAQTRVYFGLWHVFCTCVGRRGMCVNRSLSDLTGPSLRLELDSQEITRYLLGTIDPSLPLFQLFWSAEPALGCWRSRMF